MDVNYLVEINGLDDWEMGNPLSATAYKVMRKLLMLANRQRFPERIAVTNTSLCFLVGCSENSLLAARQQLIQRGLIDYKGKKKQTPVYTIHYFSVNPDYNRKICGMSRDISGDITGYSQGLDRGMVGGRYINNTENTIQGNPNGSLEDDEEATSSTHQEREAISRRWFEAFGVYPSPAIVEMVAWKGRMVCDFDMDVVGEAIRAAALRNADSPLDYILALFADWNRHHIRTMDQLDEYMDGDAG